jgi:hypothetical protein
MKDNGDCTKIEITSEESDMVFKSPSMEDSMPVKRFKIFQGILDFTPLGKHY